MNKEYRLNIPRGEINAVQFSAMPQDLLEHINHIPISDQKEENYKQLSTKDFGIVFEEEGKCEICHGTAGNFIGHQPCPGHIKRIYLGSESIYHPMLIRQLCEVLNLFCPKCYKLKYRIFLENSGVTDVNQQNRIITFRRNTTPQFKFVKDLADEMQKIPCCQHTTSYRVQKADEKGVVLQRREVEIKAKGSNLVDQRKNQENEWRQVEPADALKLFGDFANAGIDEKDLQLLGYTTKESHPRNFILNSIPVAPPTIRPNNMNMGRVSHDQMSDQYAALMMCVSRLQGSGGLSSQRDEGVKQRAALQERYSAMIKTSAGSDEQNTSDKQKGISDRLKGKQGLLRQNVMGKRVNYCSRSVISGDPTISIDQLGIPRSIAMKLTVPEVVTSTNKQFLQKLVQNGPIYPGASAVYTDAYSPIILSQAGGAGEGDKYQLELGDVVHRHLLDGDYVMFNRQPTLHKMSFMTHVAKILPYSTFRMNLCCTKPYNADYDGDEMNCHEPQSLQAVAEMLEIMLVSKQVVSCKNNAPLIGIVQDSLVGAYICTRKDKFINCQDFRKYMMFVEYPDDAYKPGMGVVQETSLNAQNVLGAYVGQESSRQDSFTLSGTKDSREHSISHNYAANGPDGHKKVTVGLHHCLCTPQPAILFPRPQWTGKQLFSLSLPESINLRLGGSKYESDQSAAIVNGQLMSGRCGKGIIGQSQGGLVHVLFNDYSPDACKAFLNNCQRTFTQMMIDHSFSIGFGDMLINENVQKQCMECNNQLEVQFGRVFCKSINGQIKLAPGQTQEQGFEQEFNQAIQKCSEELGGHARKAMNDRNALVCMLDSGSKGGRLNIQQIAAGVGQQLLHAARLKYKFLSHRTLPHFQPFDYGLKSRGYVYNSFIKGMAMHEFFFHMTGGREGVCDTAIKTADSGYVERKLMKNMESVMLCYDQTVRNDQNQIIQLRYGDDNLNTHFCEETKYPFISMTDKQFCADFYTDFQAKLSNLRRPGRSGAVQKEIGAEMYDLVQLFTEIKNMGFGESVLSSMKLQEFRCVIEPELMELDELIGYLKCHVELLRSGQLKDSTPNLEEFMSDEAVASLWEREEKLRIEYLVLLAERRWLQTTQIWSMRQNQAEDVETAKNLAVNLRRILETAAGKRHDQTTPSAVQGAIRAGGSSDAVRDIDFALTDLDQAFVVDAVNDLLRAISEKQNAESKLFRVILRQCFASKQIVYKYKLTKYLFLNCLKQVKKKFFRALGVPGDPVGPLSSHSISEPATQLTLNTFHSAGTSQLANAGLGRLKELIDFRKAKLAISYIYLNNNENNVFFSEQDVEKGEKQRQMIQKTTAALENTYLHHFLRKAEIIFDPDGTYPEDKLWLKFKSRCKSHFLATGIGELSPLVLRYELQLRQLIEKEDCEIDTAVIAGKIAEALQEDDDEEQASSKYHVDYYAGTGRQVIRIYAEVRHDHRQVRSVSVSDLKALDEQLRNLHISGDLRIKKVFWNKKEPFTHFGLDNFTPRLEESFGPMRELQEKSEEKETKQVVEYEIPGALNCYGGIFRGSLNFGKGKGGSSGTQTGHATSIGGPEPMDQGRVVEMYIEAEGSNLLGLLGRNDIDATRTYCNDLPEVYDVLGVEAARQLLVSELNATLSKQGVNRRHFLILADIMMSSPYKGAMLAINRHGMKNTNTGVIAQASFEQPAETLLAAAGYGLVDNCRTASTAVALGREMPGGTSSFQLLLDVNALPARPREHHRFSVLPARSEIRGGVAETEVQDPQSALSVGAGSSVYFRSFGASRAGSAVSALSRASVAASAASRQSCLFSQSQSRSNMASVSQMQTQQSKYLSNSMLSRQNRSMSVISRGSQRSRSQSVSNLQSLSAQQRSGSQKYDEDRDNQDQNNDENFDETWV